jgi:hypothetical protein
MEKMYFRQKMRNIFADLQTDTKNKEGSNNQEMCIVFSGHDRFSIFNYPSHPSGTGLTVILLRLHGKVINILFS